MYVAASISELELPFHHRISSSSACLFVARVSLATNIFVGQIICRATIISHKSGKPDALAGFHGARARTSVMGARSSHASVDSARCGRQTTTAILMAVPVLLLLRSVARAAFFSMPGGRSFVRWSERNFPPKNSRLSSKEPLSRNARGALRHSRCT